MRAPRPRARRAALVAALGLLAVPAGVAASPGAVPAGRSDAGAWSTVQDRGRELYLRSCATCHGPSGQGTQRGPTLVGVGAASVDFQLGTGRMPLTDENADPEHRPPAFPPEDIRALVDHVTGFGGGGPPIPDVRPRNVRLGQTLFLDNCSACHSATGTGGTLTSGEFAPSLFAARPTQVGEAIRVGPGLMPAFPADVLSTEQVDAIAAYVDTLQGEHGDLDRGGLALGRIGPITEGLVGWGVGLLLLVLVIRWLGSRAHE